MNQDTFVDTWKRAKRILGKNFITDEYIIYNSDKMKVDYWRDEIVKEVFDDLCSGEPDKISLTNNTISSMYWSKFNERNKPKYGELKECTKNICNGFGIVMAEKLNPIKNLPEYKVDSAFRCTCFMGNSHSKKIPIWSEGWERNGYKVKEESVYKESKVGQYNFDTYIQKVSDKMDVNDYDFGKDLEKE